jgi:hypothetical protein
MPNPPNSDNGNEIVSSSSESHPEGGITEEMGMQIMRYFGPQNQYQPTQAQVDKILALQEKGMDYTHKERTKISPKQVTGLIVLGIGVVVLLAIYFSCLFYAKEFLGEVIAGIVGLLTGGLGGYGIGKSMDKKDE